jgi:hypothetical protein
MIRRKMRTLSLWLGVVALIALIAVWPACRASHEEATAGVRIVQVFAQGADTSSPLVVFIHGRGGRPERFESWFRDFPVRVEVALPQGFTPSGFGWSWFDWPPGTTDDDLGDAVDAAEERLWRAIRETAHGRRSSSPDSRRAGSWRTPWPRAIPTP